MKKALIFIGIFSLTMYNTFAQVGINTTSPESVLDIRSSNQATPANNDGILIPKVDEFPASNPTINQDGMLLFVTGNGSVLRGFYYWNNVSASWILIATGNGDSDWYEESTSTTPNSINDDIYTLGEVAIGKNTADWSLDVYRNTGGRGISLILDGTHDDATYGLLSELNIDGSGNHVGVFSRPIGSGTGLRYAYRGLLNGDSSGDRWGMYNSIENSGDGIHYGTQNTLNGSGSGNKYGFHTNIPATAGGSHYGIYSDVTKTGSYSGFFNGDVNVDNGRLTLTDLGDATPTSGTGILEISGSLRIDNNEIITNSNTPLYLQHDNAGDLQVDNTTFFINSSHNLIAMGALTTYSRLHIHSSSQASPSIVDGILIPKVDEFSAANPTVNQDGMLVYATGNGAPSQGFYFWNNGTTTWEMVSAPRRIDDLSDGKSDTDGSENGSSLFLGIGAGSTDDGSNNANVGIGFESLTAITSGFNNIGIGYQSLNNHSTGSYSTSIGYRALFSSTNGNGNTALGYLSGFNNNGSQNVFLGYQAGYSETGSNRLYISNSSDTTPLIYGEFDNDLARINGDFEVVNGRAEFITNVDASGIVNSGVIEVGNNLRIDNNEIITNTNTALYLQNDNNGDLFVDGNSFFLDASTNWIGLRRTPAYRLHLLDNSAAKPTSSAWIVASDTNLKKDVKPFTDGLALLKQINPVWFTYNGKAGIPVDTGVGTLAQEFQKIAPYMVKPWTFRDEEKGISEDYLGVDYGPLSFVIVNAIKEQQEEIELLKNQIKDLKSQLDDYKKLEERILTLEMNSK